MLNCVVAIAGLIVLNKNVALQPFYWACQEKFYWFSSKTCCVKMLLYHLHCLLALPHHTLNLTMTLMCQNDKLPFGLRSFPIHIIVFQPPLLFLSFITSLASYINCHFSHLEQTHPLWYFIISFPLTRAHVWCKHLGFSTFIWFFMVSLWNYKQLGYCLCICKVAVCCLCCYKCMEQWNNGNLSL